MCTGNLAALSDDPRFMQEEGHRHAYGCFPLWEFMYELSDTNAIAIAGIDDLFALLAYYATVPSPEYYDMIAALYIKGDVSELRTLWTGTWRNWHQYLENNPEQRRNREISEDEYNMHVAELDALINHAKQNVHTGPQWGTVIRMLSHKRAEWFGPAIVTNRACYPYNP